MPAVGALESPADREHAELAIATTDAATATEHLLSKVKGFPSFVRVGLAFARLVPRQRQDAELATVHGGGDGRDCRPHGRDLGLPRNEDRNSLMPGNGIPPVAMGHQLLRALIEIGGAVALVGLIVAVLAGALLGRRPTDDTRVRGFLFGERETAQHPEPAARRFLRTAFGLLWIVDGLLQAQPRMPSAFVSRTLADGLYTSPHWLASIAGPFARMWTRHPVTVDAATVWVQLGIGVLLLVARDGALLRLGLWLSIGWGAFVWLFGEFAGGIYLPQPAWLTGAPGAVLVYVVAGALLLLPVTAWQDGRARRATRYATGGWLLLAGVLEALPSGKAWTPSGLASPFTDGVANSQPELFRAPIRQLQSAAVHHAVVMNTVVIGLLLVVGAGLVLTRGFGFAMAGVLLCALTWWLAQDFGVLAAPATDPNSALPLGLLLVSSMVRDGATADQAAADQASSATFAARHSRWRLAAALGGAVSLVAAAIVVPTLTAVAAIGPADANAVAADSGGGIVHLPNRSAPDFALTDQNGVPLSLVDLRGKLTLITFFDPVCSDDCPLIANQLAAADRQLGLLAEHVQIVAIDTNPVFHNVADVAAFTQSHGLSDLPNWHFLAGPPEKLDDVIAAYGIVVQVPTVGMIEHGEGIFFVDGEGREIAYLGDGANASLTGGYASVIRDEVRRLLA